jgi:ankyrin repeat protein
VGVVRKLLESNASVNAQDREGWSALMLGAQVDAAAVVELLLEWGALPTLQVCCCIVDFN